jgi:YbbR domain-containing protein
MSLADAARVVWSVARQGLRLLGETWGIALLAVVVAVSLWVYVTDPDETSRTARVAGAISVECVNVPPGKAEQPSCSDQSVSIRVRAPESLLDELSAENFRATADLSDVISDLARVPVTVRPDDTRVEVVAVEPAQIAVRLENLTSRTVPVLTRLVGAPPRGFEAGATTIQPEDAVISGPESLVQRTAAAEADIDLTAARTDFQQTVLLQPRDEQGGSIEGVVVEPESARVSVTMVQLEFSAPFVVQPDVSGTPAVGFEATAVQVEPSIVIVTGPVDIFQTLDPVRGVATVPVSIDGASADVVRTVALQLPPGARIELPGVTVRVTVAPSQARSGAPRAPP